MVEERPKGRKIYVSDPFSKQTENVDIFCFFPKHVEERNAMKGWYAWSEDDV